MAKSVRLHVTAGKLSFTYLAPADLRVSQLCDALKGKYEELAGGDLEINSIKNDGGYFQDPNHIISRLFENDSRIITSDAKLGPGAGGSLKRDAAGNLKKPPSALERYKKDHQDEVAAANPGLSRKEVGSLLSANYKALPPSEREPYEKTAKDALKEFRKAQGPGKRRKHNPVDPDAPKKPINAYLMFSNHKRETDDKVKHLGTQGAKEIGIAWRQLSAKDKAFWQKKALASKEQWEADMEKYKASKAEEEEGEGDDEEDVDGVPPPPSPTQANKKAKSSKKKKKEKFVEDPNAPEHIPGKKIRKNKLLEKLSKDVGPLSDKDNKDALRKAYCKKVGLLNVDDSWLKKKIDRLAKEQASS